MFTKLDYFAAFTTVTRISAFESKHLRALHDGRPLQAPSPTDRRRRDQPVDPLHDCIPDWICLDAGNFTKHHIIIELFKTLVSDRGLKSVLHFETRF